MERPYQESTPVKRLVQTYSTALSVYRGLITAGAADPEFLSIVDESIADVQQEVAQIVGMLDETNPGITATAELLTRSFQGLLTPDEAQKEPYLDDLLFSFPVTFQEAVARH